MNELKINYRMQNDIWTYSDSYIELPVTEDLFYKLQHEAKYDCWLITNPIFETVTLTLKSICRLQGYNLSSYKIKLEEINNGR